MSSHRLQAGDQVIIRKLDWQTREEIGSWTGVLVAADDSKFVVDGWFTNPRNAQHVQVDGVELLTGDKFTEFYFRERWFNVFRVASHSGQVKGWYCNVALPAQADELGISFVDLWLDLFVHPDGRYTVLDEDEFAAALPSLPREVVQAARGALQELIQLAEAGALPVG